MAKSKKIKRRGGGPKSAMPRASTKSTKSTIPKSSVKSTISKVTGDTAKTRFIMDVMKLTPAQLASPHVGTFQHGKEIDESNQKDFMAIADDYKNALTEQDMTDAIHQCRIPEGYKPFLIREVREIYHLKEASSKFYWIRQLFDGVLGGRFGRVYERNKQWEKEREPDE
jgi:hypothetical protein